MAQIDGIFAVLVLMNLRLTCVLVESLLAKYAESNASALIFTCLQNGVLRLPEPLVPAPSVSAEAVETVEDVDDADLHSPFFVTVVGKKRLRRLHRRGGCGVSVLEVQESEPVWDLKGLVYNLACQHCWRPGESTVSRSRRSRRLRQCE